MRKSPHIEEEANHRQPPKSLCRMSVARSAQISQSFQSNRIIPINNPDMSDKISSDTLSSDDNDDVPKTDFQFNQNKTASPHLSSLKRSQNNMNLPSSGFLQQISHSSNLTSYSSLKRNNEISSSIIEQIDSAPTNQELFFAKNNNKNYEKMQFGESTNTDNNDSISNDDSSVDSFEDDGLVRTQVDKNDPIQTDDNFWGQDSQKNNHTDSNTDQIDEDENDDRIEAEITNKYDEKISDDEIEEASQNFSNPNYDTKSFVPSDDISENESEEDQFGEINEEIDSTVHSQFFKQQKVVFEFINEETDELDKWDFDYMRVIYAKTIDSEIEELNEETYRILVRKSDTQHLKKQGDNFVMGIPYHIYSNLDKIYIIAPNVSDKL